MLRPVATALMVVLCGCGASGNGDANAPSVSDRGSAAPDESNRERRTRMATARRTACEEIWTIIERSQEHAILVNLSNTDAVERMAEGLARTADGVDEVEVDSDLEALLEVRDEYVETTRAMVSALGKAAGGRSAAQKAAHEKFRDLKRKHSSYLNDFNDVCNAPIE